MAARNETETEEKSILLTGASGMVGSALRPLLSDKGYRIMSLTRDRGKANDGAVFWDPDAGEIDPGKLERLFGVIHLAGENIASGKWTKAKKERIRESRVRGTGLLARTLAGLEEKPSVLVSASGVNYYGDCGEERVTEDQPAGEGFLAGVCREWEAATEPAEKGGVRVVRLRTGPVLSPKGGMLKKILPPFRAGAGGRIGNGRQYISWIAMDDLLGVIQFCLENEALRGPVNAVAPNPVTNAEFTRVLAKVLSRPALFPVPALGLRLLFGEMAGEMLLSGIRAVPRKVEEAGYTFQFPELEAALRHVLAR